MSFQEYKDSFGTYYQFNNIKDETVTIFIHGVGLDNTMWYPQKEYFENKSVLFYDLLNHGQSCGGFKVLSFETIDPTCCLSEPLIFNVVCFSTKIFIPSGISKFIS